jgi:hypothetical protein
VALMIACWAVIEGLRAWSGRTCTCAAQPAGTAELIHQRGSAPCCACRFLSHRPSAARTLPGSAEPRADQPFLCGTLNMPTYRDRRQIGGYLRVRADQHLSRTVIRFQTLAVRIADSERMSFARPQGGRNADDSVLGNPTPQGA